MAPGIHARITGAGRFILIRKRLSAEQLWLERIPICRNFKRNKSCFISGMGEIKTVLLQGHHPSDDLERGIGEEKKSSSSVRILCGCDKSLRG